MNKEGLCTQVQEKRWETAQKWEQAFWIKAERTRARMGKNLAWKLLSRIGLKSRFRGDDWNLWWKNKFNNYEFLPNEVNNAVEVGCGPYTNMRHILPHCNPRHLVLSDPLIKTYVKFPLTFINHAYRSAFCTIDDHPLEDCPLASGYFDLVVMINVLDHVRDADKCMKEVVRITAPDGLLIIGQDLSNEEDANNMKNDPGQAGHPIRVHHEWMDTYLADYKPVIKRILSREEGRAPAHHYGTYIFAGRK